MSKIPLFLYWEKSALSGGKEPGLIKLCRKTIAKYCRDDFEIRFVGPREVMKLVDIPEDVWKFTNIPMRADVIRGRLLRDYGGVWLDSDAIVMRSMKEIKEKLKDHDFVGYRKTSHGDNHIPVNFMASVPGGDTIREYVREQNRMLYNNSSMAWNELGAKPLTRAISSGAYLYDEDYFQPIPWQEQEKFYKKGDRDIPEKSFVCMYFNNGQKVRKDIPDLRYIISEEEVLDMNIGLTNMLRKSLTNGGK